MVRIPSSMIDGGNGGGSKRTRPQVTSSTLFPQGDFKGSLSELREAYSQDGTSTAKLIFRNIEPVHCNAPLLKGQPFEQTIFLSHKDVSLADADFHDPQQFPLRKTAMLLAQLATVLGAAPPADDGDGVMMEFLEFLDDLRQDRYFGARVRFVVRHRRYEKNGTQRTEASAITIERSE